MPTEDKDIGLDNYEKFTQLYIPSTGLSTGNPRFVEFPLPCDYIIY